MNEPIPITPRQNEYLKELAAGPRTTRDLVLHFMVTGTSAGRMLKKLRANELIRSSQKQCMGNVHIHELTAPYPELNIVVTTGGHGSSTRTQITDEEILYAAILRNDGLLGRRLTDQFRKVYPDRSHECVLKQIVSKAKDEGLCR